jgi:hypothetical protein
MLRHTRSVEECLRAAVDALSTEIEKAGSASFASVSLVDSLSKFGLLLGIGALPVQARSTVKRWYLRYLVTLPGRPQRSLALAVDLSERGNIRLHQMVTDPTSSGTGDRWACGNVVKPRRLFALGKAPDECAGLTEIALETVRRHIASFHEQLQQK